MDDNIGAEALQAKATSGDTDAMKSLKKIAYDDGDFDSGDWDGFELLDQLLDHPALPRDILESVAAECYDWEVEDELRQELADRAQSKLE